jgi:hypothetical protein
MRAAGNEFSAVVVASALAVVADLLQGYQVHGAVQLTVPGPGQPVAAVFAAGHFDGGDSGVACVMSFGGEPINDAGVGNDTGCEKRSDTADFGKCGAVLEEASV